MGGFFNPTASYVKNIEDDNWTKNYTWYDTKGRPIGSHSINHLGGFTKTESELDFTGVVQQSFTSHSRASTTTEVTIEENFEYDPQNRLLMHKHKVNGGNEEVLTQNTYNELSQLESKKVGNTIADPLQQVDFSYNIRGWMTGINDPTNLGVDLFGYNIKYNNPINSTISTPKYNGNITEIDWKKNSSCSRSKKIQLPI